jgi:hypothetical protein
VWEKLLPTKQCGESFAALSGGVERRQVMETRPQPVLHVHSRAWPANAHSKNLRHPTATNALFVAWYNFSRMHETVKGKTPAIASRLSDHVWTIKELIEKAAE